MKLDYRSTCHWDMYFLVEIWGSWYHGRKQVKMIGLTVPNMSPEVSVKRFFQRKCSITFQLYVIKIMKYIGVVKIVMTNNSSSYQWQCWFILITYMLISQVNGEIRGSRHPGNSLWRLSHQNR